MIKNKRSRIIITVIVVLFAVAAVGAGTIFGINAYVKVSVADRIITSEQASLIVDADCVLVLGCLVKDNGVPSDMLHDRLRRGVELYQTTMVPKLLMSGDHGRTNYDEVAAMKQFAVDAGIPSSDVFMDHAGFSTYESIYRARDIFQADKIIIVSQEYHLYRALYIAEQLGLEAYGVSSDYRNYSGQTGRDIREVLARVKDVFSCIFQPKPTYLGNVIPVSGDGDVTNDEKGEFQESGEAVTEATQETVLIHYEWMTDEELIREICDSGVLHDFMFSSTGYISEFLEEHSPAFAELVTRETMLSSLCNYGSALADSYLESTDSNDRATGLFLKDLIRLYSNAASETTESTAETVYPTSTATG